MARTPVIVLLAAATAGFLPAAGAAPLAVAGVDGPAPGHLVSAVPVPSARVLLAVETPDSTLDEPVTWTLDVPNRRWSRIGAGPPGSAQPGFLAYLPGPATAYFVPRSPGAVARFPLADRTWQQPAVPSPRPVGVSDVVTDARRGRILAWSDWDDSLWRYAPESNTWTHVARRGPWPSTAMPDGTHGYSLLAFDEAADRALLAVLPIPGRPGATWLFDPGQGTWTRAVSRPPALMMGYGEVGTESAYDPVHRRTVLFSRGTLATYDSARDRWRLPAHEAWPGLTFGADAGIEAQGGVDPWPHGLPLGALARSDHALVMDPASGRVLLLGGSSLFPRIGATDDWDCEWHPVSDLWGYDVGLNTWTLLDGDQR